MKLVINISDELYNYMCSEQPYDEHLDKRFDCQIRYSVKKGIPLPKEYGRLIDADKALKNTEEIYNASNVKDVISPEQMYVIRKILTIEPTIIEGNKGEREVRNADSN